MVVDGVRPTRTGGFSTRCRGTRFPWRTCAATSTSRRGAPSPSCSCSSNSSPSPPSPTPRWRRSSSPSPRSPRSSGFTSSSSSAEEPSRAVRPGSVLQVPPDLLGGRHRLPRWRVLGPRRRRCRHRLVPGVSTIASPADVVSGGADQESERGRSEREPTRVAGEEPLAVAFVVAYVAAGFAEEAAKYFGIARYYPRPTRTRRRGRRLAAPRLVERAQPGGGVAHAQTRSPRGGLPRLRRRARFLLHGEHPVRRERVRGGDGVGRRGNVTTRQNVTIDAVLDPLRITERRARRRGARDSREGANVGRGAGGAVARGARVARHLENRRGKGGEAIRSGARCEGGGSVSPRAAVAPGDARRRRRRRGSE